MLNSLQALARPEENWKVAGNVFSVKNGPNKGEGGEPVLGETPDYKLQGEAPEFSPVDEIASIFEKALGFSSNDRVKKDEIASVFKKALGSSSDDRAKKSARRDSRSWTGARMSEEPEQMDADEETLRREKKGGKIGRKLLNRGRSSSHR